MVMNFNLFRLFLSAVFITTVSSKKLCPAGFAPFIRDHGYALVGHVIATLPLFLPDCMTACEETLICFSINVYKDQHGGNVCELNKSNKRRSPGSFVRMTGYQYAEAERKRFCVKNDCPIKEALPEDWFFFNSSYFKMFKERKSWADARQYCQNLGGDLASIASATEHEYVHEMIVLPTEYILFRLILTDLVHQRRFESLLNGAAMQTVDGYPSLYLDGLGAHATTPAFSLRRSSVWTIGVWIKTPNPERTMSIFSDYTNDLNAAFRLFIEGNKFVCEFYTVQNVLLRYVSSSSIPANVFVHLAVTFDLPSLNGKVYFNGVLDSDTIPSVPVNRKAFFVTDSLTFAIGQSQTGQVKFIGWMRGLTMVGRLLELDQIIDVKDGAYVEGAWFGLNDKATERRIGWIDGLPLTYQPEENAAFYNPDTRDCAVIIKSRNDETVWKMESCDGKTFFVCEKH